MSRVMHAVPLLRRRPMLPVATLVVVAAVLVHLTMLLGASHGLAHRTPTGSTAAPEVHAHAEIGPQATAPADHSAATVSHLMLQLCFAVLAAGLLWAFGSVPTVRTALVARRTAGRAAPPPRRRSPPHGPGRSRVDTGLVLRV